MQYLDSLFGLSSKTALVTGGATGIGRMIAESLAKAGAEVFIASRKGDICETVAAEINACNPAGSVIAFAGDVGSAQSCAALADTLHAQTDQLHILVNNAGISWGAPLEEFPHAAFEKVMNINVAGAFELTRLLLPMLEQSSTASDPARVINLGSVMGHWPIGDGAYSYSASKAAIMHLTKILAKEKASHHVTFNALAPGPFQSKMTAFATSTEEGAKAVGADVPMGRIGKPSDIAGAMLFLCGQGGAYVTGCMLPLDGGIGVTTGGEIFGAAK